MSMVKAPNDSAKVVGKSIARAHRTSPGDSLSDITPLSICVACELPSCQTNGK